MTMAEEGFLKRWARRKTESRHGIEPAPEPALEHGDAPGAEPVLDPQASAPASAPAPAREAAVETQAPPPTMADVALLTPQSDFSAFVRPDVAAEVRRTALKKLFADPHFNTMDRLDMYMDDYNKPSPMSEAMLASLRHAKSVFRHLAEDEETAEEDAAEVPAEAAQPPAALAQSPQEALQPQDLQEAPPRTDPTPDAAPGPIVADAPYQRHLPETETR
jgi:hypothetical protein